jgi:hypothetical protein
MLTPNLLCIAADDDFPYKQRREIVSKLFFEIYREFGANIRLAGTIEGCGNKDLAKQLIPSERELGDRILHKIIEIKQQDSNKDAIYLNKLSTDETMILVDAVSLNVAFYRVGYGEATKTFMGDNVTFCQEMQNYGQETITKGNKRTKSK